MNCVFCKQQIPLTDRVGRQETCPHCRRDLHACIQCGFYDKAAYNDCREPQADRVVEKEISNFCDYFVPQTGGATAPVLDPAAEAKRKLEAMFKK